MSTAFKLVGPEPQDPGGGVRRPQDRRRRLLSGASQDRGVKGGLGLAEDPSHASLSCHQIGPITLPARLKAGEEVFGRQHLPGVQEQKVVRFTTRSAMP